MSKWIKKDDKIIVTSGNDKGLIGRVLRRQADKVVVEGVNKRKKHMKRRTQEGSSGIIEIEMPIHISNVSLCNAEGKPVKVKVRRAEDGSKELFYLDGEKQVVHRQLRKGV